MTCHSCQVDCVKAGKYGRKQIQRYLCKQCSKRYSEPQDKPLVLTIISSRSFMGGNYWTAPRWATAPERFQLTSDAFPAYPDAIAAALYDRADYAQLIKLYGRLPGSRGDYYRPAKIKGTVSAEIMGMPAPKRICTSHVERKNGTLRQWCKRMTRLTYAFSKSRENLRAALALHFAYYNFCRVHGSIRVTPAMEAEITDYVWTLGELIAA